MTGTSREWTEDEVESASVLMTLYGRFIEVWRQKEAIVQRNRMTRLLIRNAGHEVRTPLNSIINYLEAALEEKLDERARFHLKKSLEASKSLVFVVNDLLHLTEAEGGSIAVHEANVNLRSMISEVAAAFKGELDRKGLETELQVEAAVPQIVKCDPNGLRQVLSNLLANAVQGSDQGCIRIALSHVTTTESNLSVHISVKDEGLGLSEQQLDGIFQDFEQILDDEDTMASTEATDAANDLRTKTLGIGLGLATAARFVRLNHGQIIMSSEGAGQGTTVSITIPVRDAAESSLAQRRSASQALLPTPPTERLHQPPHAVGSHASAEFGTTQGPPKPLETSSSVSSSASTLPTPSQIVPSPSSSVSSQSRYPFPITALLDGRQKFSILVAEDNPLNSRLLETRLKKRGHDVQIAADGKACFEVFKSNHGAFDIILMDIQMPLLDGVEATKLIREFESSLSTPMAFPQHMAAYGRVPIVAVSASLSEERVHEFNGRPCGF